MKQKYTGLLLLSFAFSSQMIAQKRYFDPVFPAVKVTSNIVYGINATVLYAAPPPNGIGQAVPQSLKMDVYEPQGDTASARPLVILLHSGGFLPPQINGGCNGTIQDGEVVELAKRLAHRGFVVAAADYRLGWNPVATTVTERTYTFVNAVHRGVQDSRTCVRFFKKDHFENDAFKIDPDKITLWGLGTGGVITLASATLDAAQDWYKQKFVTPAGPMVYEVYNGNPDGTSVGVAPPWPGEGDTLCYPNHVGYSSNFALGVHMMGFLPDTSWFQANDIPLLSFGCPDYSSYFIANEPCIMGDIGVLPPFVEYPILTAVAGSCAVQARQADLGLNVVWEAAAFDDPLSAHALDINGGIEGFYPFIGTLLYAPWSFSASLSPYGVQGVMCDTNFLRASAYLDTVLAYFAPRACTLMQLNADCSAPVVHTTAPDLPSWRISPNPAHETVYVIANDPFTSIRVFDRAGKMVLCQKGLNHREFQIPISHLPAGMYWIKASFEHRVLVGKLIKW